MTTFIIYGVVGLSKIHDFSIFSKIL